MKHTKYCSGFIELTASCADSSASQDVSRFLNMHLGKYLVLSFHTIGAACINVTACANIHRLDLADYCAAVAGVNDFGLPLIGLLVNITEPFDGVLLPWAVGFSYRAAD